MSVNLRRKVLTAFKDIHRARFQVFKGDENALAHVRTEINDRYRSNMEEKDPEKIAELVSFSNDCMEVLKKHVIQFESTPDDTYRANITPDTHLMDNTEFQENVSRKELMSLKFSGKVDTKSRKPKS